VIDGNSGDADENGVWHDQENETVRQRLRDVDEACGMIQEVVPVVGCGISKGAVSDL